MDVVLEYDNYVLKEIIRGLGVNIIEDSVWWVCRVFFIFIKLFFVFDIEMNVNKVLGKYIKKFVKEDLIKVVKIFFDWLVCIWEVVNKGIYVLFFRLF